MQTFAQMGRDPSRAPSNFFITETEGSKSPKMRRRRRRVAPDWKHKVSRAKPRKPIFTLKQTKIKNKPTILVTEKDLK